MTEDAISVQLATLTDAVKRVENKLDKEVSELKSEQIGELKKSYERLADDQRRLWNIVHEHRGGLKVSQVILTLVGSLLSGAIVALIVHFAH